MYLCVLLLILLVFMCAVSCCCSVYASVCVSLDVVETCMCVFVLVVINVSMLVCVLVVVEYVRAIVWRPHHATVAHAHVLCQCRLSQQSHWRKHIHIDTCRRHVCNSVRRGIVSHKTLHDSDSANSRPIEWGPQYTKLISHIVCKIMFSAEQTTHGVQ